MLSLEELLKMDDYMDDEISIKIAKRCIEHADKDKDGFLTAKELKDFLMMLNPGEDDYMDDEISIKIAKRCIEHADKDKDDFLTAKELKDFLMMLNPSENDE